MPSELTWAEQSTIKALQIYQSTQLYINRSTWSSKETQPDFVRTYNGLDDNRVFIPKNTLSEAPLPLIIDVHGGGWVIGNPSEDDPLCRYLADNCGCVVVSINYRKAPKHPFPAAFLDIVTMIPEVIADPELRIDHTKVILSGSSAGGNLIMAAAQSPSLVGKIAGVIALYPLVDVSVTKAVKLQNRLDKSVPDPLDDIYDLVKKAYIQNGESLEDLRVSPYLFGDRSLLPKRAFIVGCAQDMLCHEASLMADKLAGNVAKTATESGWHAQGVVWEVIEGQPHGFNFNKQKDPEKEAERARQTQQVYRKVADWIVSDVFQSSPTNLS